MENSNESDPSHQVLLRGESILCLDAVTGEPMDIETIKNGDMIYAWIGPAVTASLPPQATAFLILANIPADYAVPMYYEIVSVTAQAAAEEEGKSSVEVLTSEGKSLKITGEAKLMAHEAEEVPGLEDLIPGTRMLVWTGMDGKVTKVLVFPYDYAGYLPDRWRQDLESLVRKDYSHPSVIMYSIGNEVAETAQTRGIALTKQMTEHMHSLDSTRPVTCGVNIFFNFLSSMGFGVYSDDKAKKEAEAAAKRAAAGKAAPKKKAVGSEFFNNLAGFMGADFMKWGASLPPCDWKTKDAFANMDAAGYNYGIRRYKHDLKKYPHRLIVGSETFCSDAYRFYELAKHEPRLLGDFVWAGMDYLGEVGIGAWEYPDYVPDFSHGPGWIAAGAGRIDLIGRTQGEALYTRVALEREKGPLLAVWPVNHTKEKHSPSAWRMSHAIPSWSWHGCEGKPAMVEVYARAAKVALKINGKTVGEAAPKNDCVVRFSCTYEDGTVEAVSYDAAGNEIGRTALHTANTETRLCLVPEEETVRPGGLAFVQLRYTDENGTVKPLERGTVTVKVRGGTLLGLGSACAYSERGYLSDTTDTYFGEALAVVRADADADTVELTAADGTHNAACCIPCKE